MSYSAAETETILNCTNEEKTWKVYTLMPTVITKLRRAGMEPTKIDKDGAHYFDLDFNQVSFRAKSKSRNMSEEQRKAAADRLAKARQSKAH